MTTFLLVFIVTAVVLALCLLGLAVKIILKKHGEFKRQCSSIDPYTGERMNCMCGKTNVLDSSCEQKTHTILEVDQTLLKEALKK
ncbi:MAG: hypothetical protein LKE30_07480 [Bacteroidales bacterium]|jgi:hypothetical protein|nr:hypothetical protein [Bacteroidales bacterium]